MSKVQISNDDLEDVKELTSKLDKAILEILEDTQLEIAISSLLSTTINCMIDQCDTILDTLMYKNLLIKAFDLGIESFMMRDKK